MSFCTRIKEKEKQKFPKFDQIKIEPERIWTLLIAHIPIVIGEPGTVTDIIKTKLKKIGINYCAVKLLQKGSFFRNGKISLENDENFVRI